MRITLSLLVTLVMTSYVYAAALTIELGGTDYNGPPAYEIVVDGIVVASGKVENSEGQTVEVEIPEKSKLLSVRFTNDAAAPVAPDGSSGGDRNLIIRSITLDGIGIPIAEFTGERFSNQGEFLFLYSNTELELNLNAGITVGDGSAQPQIEGAGLSESKSNCSASAEVTNYASNAIDLVPEQYSALLEILNTRGCALTVTGYSSTSGPAAMNISLSEARAKAVLDYLLFAGSSFTTSQVIAAGETTKFGPLQADNRRVVVELN